MDVWLRISTAESWSKSLTLVVTPFKKFCGSQDLQYRQCRYSTKCVRRELFCDGRVNCAWPYAEPAGRQYVQCVCTIYSMYNVQCTVCTMYSVQYVQCTVYSMYNVQSTVCTMYSVQCSVCTIYRLHGIHDQCKVCTMYSELYRIYNVQCKVCTMYSELYSVYNVQYSVQYTLCTICTLCTVYSILHV